MLKTFCNGSLYFSGTSGLGFSPFKIRIAFVIQNIKKIIRPTAGTNAAMKLTPIGGRLSKK